MRGHCSECEEPLLFKNQHKFCSRKCYNSHMKKNPNKGCYRVGHIQKKEGDSPNWKGNVVGYTGMHMRIKSKYGIPNKCENPVCQFPDEKKFEWANLSGEYKYDRKDWMMLCIQCHRRRDFNKDYCKNGHRLVGENLYVNPKGHRNCKVCRRKSW